MVKHQLPLKGFIIQQIETVLQECMKTGMGNYYYLLKIYIISIKKTTKSLKPTQK